MLRGSMVALITPMTDDGSIDEAVLEALVDFHLQNQTDVIVAMGTTGESATLSHKEHRHVVKRVVELVNGKIPVMAGTGSNNTAEALDLTAAAKEDGADACLLVTPYYNKPMQEGLYQHYKLIAEKVAIPQVLYNVPGRTACDLLPETTARLADIENIVAIKEATGDLNRAKQTLELCGDRLDVFSGDDATAIELMLMGGKGNISVTANLAPQAMHELCAAALAGDRAKAEAINAPLAGLHKKLFLQSSPIPAKWAMHKMGFGGKGIRLPLTVFADKYHAELLEAMKAAGIEV
ncbi:MAG TPA: 4-hydroxy-tetrahydrodipicolinate synthase [Leucothrix mucor]|uniref:4-hydroxy-tetrahydrodipicolinate synthase n=1 Tax=Leucothrix mucor TaxID=45248 RepID=A0A7V2SYF9_LEUMU|nr:4-hydroxy-tetrahydrodipicolinate synthase [Leucothrix mucor]